MVTLLSPPLLLQLPGRFSDTLLQAMITLDTGVAVVLSSFSVCDGHWLAAPEGRGFDMWERSAGWTALLALSRSSLCLALVIAIFGLELLMVSQLCEDPNGRKRWRMGALLLMAAFFLSAAGTLTYILALPHDPAAAFTLSFWCQFVGVALFFLNATCGLYLERLTP
ncbi:voltage-dependent calcium channel gamma-like subunit [Gastrophryne carolinensis]